MLHKYIVNIVLEHYEDLFRHHHEYERFHQVLAEIPGFAGDEAGGLAVMLMAKEASRNDVDHQLEVGGVGIG